MDRYRDRTVMDRNRPYGRGRDEERNWGEDFDREGYTREGRWRGREPEWEHDRYGRGGGYGQGSAGGYNEQQTSSYRSDYAGEDRWRSNRGTRSSGAGYDDGYDRGRGREYGRGSTGEVRDEWSRGMPRGLESYERTSRSRDWDRDRDWNEDTRDQHGTPGIMESIGRFFGFGPKNYRRSDERITEEVNDRLYRHPDIDASDIDVTVREAEVTLSGTVDDRRAKYLAEDLVDQVMGVKEVNNQLRVRRHDRTGSSYRGTSPMMGTEGTGTTGTLGQSQTGTTRDIGETSRSRNK